MIAYFHAATLAESRESMQSYLLLSIIIHIFAPCSPFVGLVEKISGVVSLAPDIFFCSFLNFSPQTFGGFKETRYICSILKNYRKMTTTLLKKLFLHAMVWKVETPQCFSIRHRTPKACLLFIPKIYRYDCKNQFGW